MSDDYDDKYKEYGSYYQYAQTEYEDVAFDTFGFASDDSSDSFDEYGYGVEASVDNRKQDEPLLVETIDKILVVVRDHSLNGVKAKNLGINRSDGSTVSNRSDVMREDRLFFFRLNFSLDFARDQRDAGVMARLLLKNAVAKGRFLKSVSNYLVCQPIVMQALFFLFTGLDHPDAFNIVKEQFTIMRRLVDMLEERLRLLYDASVPISIPEEVESMSLKSRNLYCTKLASLCELQSIYSFSNQVSMWKRAVYAAAENAMALVIPIKDIRLSGEYEHFIQDARGGQHAPLSFLPLMNQTGGGHIFTSLVEVVDHLKVKTTRRKLLKMVKQLKSKVSECSSRLLETESLLNEHKVSVKSSGNTGSSLLNVSSSFFLISPMGYTFTGSEDGAVCT